MENSIVKEDEIIEKDVKTLVNEADILISNTIEKINNERIQLYFNIGKMVVDYKRINNTKYGESVIKEFSENLYLKYGSGFNYSNITRMIKFYEIFSNVAPGQHFNQKVSTRQQSDEKVSARALFKNVTWSHIRELLRFDDIKIIEFYLNEIENKKLTRDELVKQLKSLSYERRISNQRKGPSKHKIEENLHDPIDLNINNKKRTERQLEDEIIKNIKTFKKEFGNNILFSENQYKINVNSLIYKIDIVLYDKENKYYILIDLKINKVKQKDISQMKFYIDYFNKYEKDEFDNNTIGIILCETKDIRVENGKDIYQIRYFNELPKQKDLEKIINENKIILLKTEKLELR